MRKNAPKFSSHHPPFPPAYSLRASATYRWLPECRRTLPRAAPQTEPRAQHHGQLPTPCAPCGVEGREHAGWASRRRRWPGWASAAAAAGRLGRVAPPRTTRRGGLRRERSDGRCPRSAVGEVKLMGPEWRLQPRCTAAAVSTGSRFVRVSPYVCLCTSLPLRRDVVLHPSGPARAVAQGFPLAPERIPAPRPPRSSQLID